MFRLTRLIDVHSGLVILYGSIHVLKLLHQTKGKHTPSYPPKKLSETSWLDELYLLFLLICTCMLISESFCLALVIISLLSIVFWIGVWLLYNGVLVSIIQQHESAMCVCVCVCVYVYTPSLLSLHAPPNPTHLGNHRAPNWAI